MKKLVLLALICSGIPAFSDGLPDIPISTVSPMNEFQTMQTQKFKREELNLYTDDIQAEKKKFEKRNKTPEQKTQEVKEQIQQAVDRKYQNMGQSQFVQENGQLRIKYGN